MTEEARNIAHRSGKALPEEQRELLMGKVLDNPDALTDEEMDCFLNDRELRELYNMAVLLRSGAAADKKSKAQRGIRLHKWAAAAILLLSISAIAATITIRTMLHDPVAAEQAEAVQADDERTAAIESEEAVAEQADKEQAEVRLEEGLTFENQTLAEIARQLAKTFGCKVTVVDAETEAIRLYLTLPKGSNAADFIEIIDAYDALEAAMEDGGIVIKRQEAAR